MQQNELPIIVLSIFSIVMLFLGFACGWCFGQAKGIRDTYKAFKEDEVKEQEDENFRFVSEQLKHILL